MFLPRPLWCGVRIRGGVLRRLLQLWRRLPISLPLWAGLFGMIGMGRGFWTFWRLCGSRSRRLLAVLRGARWRRCGRPAVVDGDGCVGLVVRQLLVG